MDFSRRYQGSWPTRPSPLGTSQESRKEPSRIHTSSAPNEPRRHEEDRARPTNRYDYASPTPVQVYTGASRASYPPRESTSTQGSPVRSQQGHSRHASLDGRRDPMHRRHNSQPQAGHSQEGRHRAFYFVYLLFPIIISIDFFVPRSAPLHISLCPGFRNIGVGLVPWFLFDLSPLSQHMSCLIYTSEAGAERQGLGNRGIGSGDRSYFRSACPTVHPQPLAL
jgi:hypothetical protein